MVSLSVQDKFDGLGKVSQLRRGIGREFSDNTSSTCRSRLISVSADGDTCVTEEVAAYGREPRPGRRIEPSWLTWNAMFS